MEEETHAPQELRRKVEEYANFLEQTLKPQLEAAVEAREETENDIDEYGTLSKTLVEYRRQLSENAGNDERPPKTESIVDLGHGEIYCKACIEDPARVFVHAGMGFHVELTLGEAIEFVQKRIKFLRGEVLELRARRAKTIAGHVEDSLHILQQLAKESRDANRGLD